MDTRLLDVLFRSEKRKNMLLLLQNGPLETTELLKNLNTNRQALLPQIKILENSYLVTHYEDSYELTSIGKLIVSRMKTLLGTVDLLDTDIDYWGKRNMDFCHPFLLERIHELSSCCIVKPSLVNLYEINKDFIEMCGRSKDLYFIFTFTHPEIPPLVSQFIERGMNTHIIITRELHQKLKKEHSERVQRFIDSGKVRYYIYQGDIKLFSFTLNDDCMILRLLTEDGSYDYKQAVCCNPHAIKWGKELFDHYLKDSTLISEI